MCNFHAVISPAGWRPGSGVSGTAWAAGSAPTHRRGGSNATDNDLRRPAMTASDIASADGIEVQIDALLGGVNLIDSCPDDPVEAAVGTWVHYQRLAEQAQMQASCRFHEVAARLFLVLI